MKQVDCRTHGRQGIGLVCTHVAHAIASRARVGFFWGDIEDTGRPDAWCTACELALKSVIDDATYEQWFVAADFKILCVGCWDEAKQIQFASA